MWLPRLRFTLVPHSSRNQFWKIFFFFFSFSSLVWVFFFFVNFSAQRFSSTFAQSRGVVAAGAGWGEGTQTRPVPPCPGRDPPQVQPGTLGSPGTTRDFPKLQGHSPGATSAWDPPLQTQPCVIGLMKAKPDLSFGVLIFFFFLTLHKCSFWVQFVAWTLR